MKEKDQISRRNFISKAAAVGAVGAVGIPVLMNACKTGTVPQDLVLPPLLDIAPDGPELKAGLIGCGGRGTGAAMNFLSAGPNLKITALGDVLQDRLDDCFKQLIEKKQNEVAKENCFVGFDAFEKVISSGVDIIILATPPFFRPEHFAAAVQAGKHVFMEKPVCVDPVGARSIMATAKKAETLGLSVVTGTQRRHQRDYIGIYKRVMAGDMGEIVAANAYWNGGKLWHKDPRPDWTEMEYMIRDWVNWCWLSGDHIVEQHVHNLDVINWFTGSHPVKAVGFGSRLRRVTGDQFDNFSIDYIYENDMHLHSMCRQINGCVNNVSEFIMGTKGHTDCHKFIYNPDGTVKFEYPYPLNEDGESTGRVKVGPYVQEHIDLVTGIRRNEPYNEAENTAISTLTAIMGRISAYTGKETTWDEMMNSDLKLGPKVFVMGPVDINKEVPIAGEAYVGK
ncbi:Gfo/Idh/MocA family protein [Bacteroidota bacterium]